MADKSTAQSVPCERRPWQWIACGDGAKRTARPAQRKRQQCSGKRKKFVAQHFRGRVAVMLELTCEVLRAGQVNAGEGKKRTVAPAARHGQREASLCCACVRLFP